MRGDLYNGGGGSGNGVDAPPQDHGTTGPPDLKDARLEQCVPVEAIGMPDESEQMANPEPGDLVTYTVEGKVSRIEGGHAYVDPTSINGQPVEATKPEADSMAALQGDAEGMGLL